MYFYRSIVNINLESSVTFIIAIRLTSNLVLMNGNKSSGSIQNIRIMSFFTFLAENYELSKFVLPKKRPIDDTLKREEMEALTNLMKEKDFYEINTIIRKRYNKA